MASDFCKVGGFMNVGAKKPAEKLRSGLLNRVRSALMLLLLVAPLLASCGGVEVNYKITPFSVAYNDGLRLLLGKDYESAVDRFTIAIQQHPYNRMVSEAQLLLAYTHFLAEDFDLANLELETFIETYPTNQHLAYALYLRGMCFYIQISSIERDQHVTRQARDIFSQLSQVFPQSTYAVDARYKMDFLNNLLAAKQMDVGRFYLWRDQVAPALRRFNNVIQEYSSTAQVPEALYRMIEGYLQLGLNQEAYMTAHLLGHNYVDSEWYQKGYALLDKAGIKTP